MNTRVVHLLALLGSVIGIILLIGAIILFIRGPDSVSVEFMVTIGAAGFLVTLFSFMQDLTNRSMDQLSESLSIMDQRIDDHIVAGHPRG